MSELDLTQVRRDLEAEGPLPQHIAVIMDGNGRWATQRNKPRIWGHRQGVKSVRLLVEAAGNLGIKVLTLFAFSEENWGRPETEVTFILSLLERYLQEDKETLQRHGVQLRTIGDLDRLPAAALQSVRRVENELRGNSQMILNVALSYGSKGEIAHACQELARKVAQGELHWQDIGPAQVNDHLWTSGLPDPELMIRTSGEQRLSNFLLWQSAYAELYFSPVCWPDFRPQHLCEALREFQRRQRRFGLTPDQCAREKN